VWNQIDGRCSIIYFSSEKFFQRNKASDTNFQILVVGNQAALLEVRGILQKIGNFCRL
jgi:hypothetical protein